MHVRRTGAPGENLGARGDEGITWMAQPARQAIAAYDLAKHRSVLTKKVSGLRFVEEIPFTFPAGILPRTKSFSQPWPTHPLLFEDDRRKTEQKDFGA